MILSRRSWVIGGLILSPVLVYVVLGGYALWSSGLTFWAWALLPVCWLVAWLVGRLWPPPIPESLEPMQSGAHWTDRDRAAFEIVRTRQQGVAQWTPAQLIDPHFYIEQVKSLAMELAAHYYPQASDPYSSLKVTEVLSAMHLAVEDLEELVTETLPVAQWLTIGQWQALGQTPKWYQRVQDSVWLSSIIYNPVNLLRYFTSKATVEPLGEQVQQELLVRLYLRFISQVGFYLIEMNSGRLRGGTQRYRRYFGRGRSSPATGSPATGSPVVGVDPKESVESAERSEPAPVLAPVQIALVGQVSSGKSSVVNALMGDNQAASDVLPTTREVRRYAITLGDRSSADRSERGATSAKAAGPPGVSVVLLDTPGYGEAGASHEQRRQIEAAVTSADAVLLILSANTAARKPDKQLLQQLEDFYLARPDLKFPPVIGVLTHVDLLKPSQIWEPPYDWQQPTDTKGRQIREALQYVAEVLGSRVRVVVPVCSCDQPARQWGIQEALIPALANLLTDAQATSLLRMFESELQTTHWRKLLHDVKQTGWTLIEYWRNRQT
jgi:predicted GTPase